MRITSERCMRLGSTTKVIVIILVIGGTFGVLGILLCAGIFYSMINTMGTDVREVQAAADSFLEDLKANRVESAYAKTTKAFQNAQTLNQFSAFVEHFSMFKTRTSKAVSDVKLFQRPVRKEATIKITLYTDNNAMSCTVVLFEEGNRWLVQQLSVP